MRKFKAYSPTILFLVFVFTLTVLFFVSPKRAYSENEKRQLAAPPTVSWSSLIDGSLAENFETYLADHFPLRDAFVGVQAYYELATGRNGASDVYFGQDGYLIAAESTTASEETVRTNMENYAAFARYLMSESEGEGLGEKAKELDSASIILVPQTGYILDDKLPAVHRPYHDAQFFAAATEELGDVELIDVRDALSNSESDAPLYFKTDHHLTMDGAYAVYTAYCAAKGLTPQTQYTVERFDGFYGTSYSKGGFWGSDPDTVALYHSELADEVTVRISANGIEEETVHDSLFFPAHLDNMDKYPVYLDGNNGLVTIENPEAPEGTLLILKDSFAHNVTTLLCQHYRKIVMVDLRYYSDSADMTVRDLIAVHGIRDVLFLYGIDSLATDSSASFKLFYGAENALS